MSLKAEAATQCPVMTANDPNRSLRYYQISLPLQDTPLLAFTKQAATLNSNSGHA